MLIFIIEIITSLLSGLKAMDFDSEKINLFFLLVFVS